MTRNGNCQRTKRTCQNLKSKCKKKLGNVLGSSSNANKCKKALGSKTNNKVHAYCKVTCNKCGKPSLSIDIEAQAVNHINPEITHH